MGRWKEWCASQSSHFAQHFYSDKVESYKERGGIVGQWIDDRCAQFDAWLRTRPLRRLFRWVCGSNYVHRKPTATNGVQSLVTLFVAVLTIATGLIVYVQKDSQPRAHVLAVYLLLSSAPSWLTFAIMRLGVPVEDGKMAFAFDRGAVTFAKFCLFAIFATVSGVAYAYWWEQLPGQVSQVKLPQSGAERHRFASGQYKGHAGVKVYYKIVPTSFDKDRVPSTLHFEIELAGALRDTWKIASVDGVIGDPNSGEKVELPDRPQLDTEAPPYKRGASWHFLEPTKKYTLIVYLHPDGSPDSSQQDRVESLVQKLLKEEERLLTTTAYYKPPR